MTGIDTGESALDGYAKARGHLALEAHPTCHSEDVSLIDESEGFLDAILPMGDEKERRCHRVCAISPTSPNRTDRHFAARSSDLAD